jgi:hypothetical protein
MTENKHNNTTKDNPHNLDSEMLELMRQVNGLEIMYYDSKVKSGGFQAIVLALPTHETVSIKPFPEELNWIKRTTPKWFYAGIDKPDYCFVTVHVKHYATKAVMQELLDNKLFSFERVMYHSRLGGYNNKPSCPF